MPLCVTVSGSVLSATTTAAASCSDYLIMTATDYNASVPVYTIADVAEMSGAVVAVWVIAWSIKVFRRAL